MRRYWFLPSCLDKEVGNIFFWLLAMLMFRATSKKKNDTGSFYYEFWIFVCCLTWKTSDMLHTSFSKICNLIFKIYFY